MDSRLLIENSISKIPKLSKIISPIGILSIHKENGGKKNRENKNKKRRIKENLPFFLFVTRFFLFIFLCLKKYFC